MFWWSVALCSEQSRPRPSRKRYFAHETTDTWPGPAFASRASRLVAVLLLAVVTLTASGIQNAASVALQQTLDANWRGAYDILVTSTGNVGELSGLLAPNSLSAGSASLTLDDLARIRSVAGIEVAAPIGEVIVPGLKSGAVSITLPRDAIPARAAPRRSASP